MSYILNKMKFPVYLIQVTPVNDGEYDAPMYWTGVYYLRAHGVTEAGLTSNPFKGWGFESYYVADMMQKLLWCISGRVVPVDPATGQRVNDTRNDSIHSDDDPDTN